MIYSILIYTNLSGPGFLIEIFLIKVNFDQQMSIFRSQIADVLLHSIVLSFHLKPFDSFLFCLQTLKGSAVNACVNSGLQQTSCLTNLILLFEGNPIHGSGIGLFINSIDLFMRHYLYSPTAGTFYNDSPSRSQLAQTWQYLGIVYDQNQGNLNWLPNNL